MQPIDLAVIAGDDAPTSRSLADEFARRLGVERARESAASAAFRLIVSEERIELCGPGVKSGCGVRVDFSAIQLNSISPREPIAKAMGRGTRTVIDATAGMGHDAFRLTCMGFEVIAIERSPVVALLLEDGLRRANAKPELSDALCGRLRLVVGDARSTMIGLPPVDVVYMDPMYPPKRKESALPKKEIQVLRAVVGDDADAAELFEVAMRRALKRVVVKRPTHAPPLAADPVASHTGKLARFDVYVPGSSLSRR